MKVFQEMKPMFDSPMNPEYLRLEMRPVEKARGSSYGAFPLPHRIGVKKLPLLP
jgi:hypothetical protein